MITHLDHLSRNKTTEKNIDMRMALYDGSLKSIGVFLDVLDELISTFNTAPERHKLLRIQSFLKYKGDIHNYRHPENILGKVEHEYLINFWTYLQDIRGKLYMSHGSTLDIIKNTAQHIQRQIFLNNLTNDQIKESIELSLKQYSTFSYAFASQGENLAVIFHHPSIILYIVRSWSDYTAKPGRDNFHLIVTTDNEFSIPFEIATQGNVSSLAIRNERGYFDQIILSNPIQYCINRIRTASEKLNSNCSTEAKDISEYSSCLEKLIKLREGLQEYSRAQGHLFLEELKLTRKYIEVANDRIFNNHAAPFKKQENTLRTVHTLLSGMWDSWVNELNLSEHIRASLLEIKRNDGLYRLKNSDSSSQNTFKEENLTAVLASLLRAAYFKNSKISIQREAYIGSGRADIKITNLGKTIGLIESKLATENFSQRIYEGLHQLFKRYSENDVINEGSPIDLYLVIFSFDREFGAIAQHIEAAVDKYSLKKNIRCQKHECSENHLTFTYIEPRETYGFLNKSRNVTIYLCNMEVDYKAKLLASAKRKK
ncbi:hypothetical protein CXQ80_08100 [Pseudomonas sp. 02C 26]|uniref:hypothetical protein n=1 Tax=Pseudomonas sp. 02C 26 TaxID=2054914 RepID=UPI000C6D44AE|nr:hypothetical protein [Pseudomonas sp. 02C 26]AUF95802.1 hypothetical protein CXQ80_08100 [Pseudomonas sp. 02C 26]